MEAVLPAFLSIFCLSPVTVRRTWFWRAAVLARQFCAGNNDYVTKLFARLEKSAPGAAICFTRCVRSIFPEWCGCCCAVPECTFFAALCHAGCGPFAGRFCSAQGQEGVLRSLEAARFSRSAFLFIPSCAQFFFPPSAAIFLSIPRLFHPSPLVVWCRFSFRAAHRER